MSFKEIKKKKKNNINHTDNSGLFYALSIATQLGFMFILPIFGFMFLGYLIDKYFKYNNLFVIVGILLGIVIATYQVYNTIISLINKK